MLIRPLADHPEAVPLLADWFFTEWNSYDKRTHAEIEEQLRQNLDRESVPITFVALEKSKVIGTVSLDLSDLPPYDHLYSPWLAALYVHPDFRHRGVGRALVARVIAFGRSQNLATIFLWTSGSSDFYQKCGWRILLKTAYRERPISILQITP